MCELELVFNHGDANGMSNPASGRCKAEEIHRLFLQGQFRYLDDWFAIIVYHFLHLTHSYSYFPIDIGKLLYFFATQ